MVRAEQKSRVEFCRRVAGLNIMVCCEETLELALGVSRPIALYAKAGLEEWNCALFRVQKSNPAFAQNAVGWGSHTTAAGTAALPVHPIQGFAGATEVFCLC